MNRASVPGFRPLRQRSRRLLIGTAATPKNSDMRSLLLTVLLAALCWQSALAGGWGRHEERRQPAPPRFQAQRPPPAFGGPRPAPAPEPPRPQAVPQQQEFRPLSSGEAAHRAQQINGGGRVLAVDPAQSGYRVRVLKDGEVRSVYVPGR